MDQILVEPAKTMLTQISGFLIDVLLVIFILIVGWIIAKFVIKTLVTKVLRLIRIDYASDRIGLDGLLAKGGIKYSLSELIGVICYWLVLLVTFVVAVNAVGLTVAADLLNQIVLYVPNVIAALFILVLGMFIAALLKNIVQTAAVNVGLSQVNFLTKTVEVIVIVFAVIMALEQLKIGVKITELTVGIVLGSVGLTFALAFGIGCKEIAAKFIAELIDKMKTKK